MLLTAADEGDRSRPFALRQSIAAKCRHVVGIGPQFGYIFPAGSLQGYLNLKAYWEFAAENRPSGWDAWVTLALSPSAAPSAPPVITK